jgi:hypothetical protein
MKKKAKRESAIPTVYFGCRIGLDVAERIRQRARKNDRALGAETSRVLRFALDLLDKKER